MTANVETCFTCGESLLMSAPDGQGGMIYAYNCTAEVVVSCKGELRRIKECPDWGGLGRANAILSDRSTAKEPKP